MSVRLVIAQSSRITGGHLTTALRARNVTVLANGGNALVSYGVRLGDATVPTLNANAGMADKFEQLIALRDAGVLVPNTSEDGQGLAFPMLARKRQHRAGTDLRPVFQPEEIPWRMASGSEFFVEYVPRQSEFRTWVYRKRHLGSYTKVMDRPEEYTRIGWNYHNGFSFRFIGQEDVPPGAVAVAISALKALDLDFGAVDILLGKDNRFYCLEVNTAPGVESPDRVVMKNLALRIAKLEEAGYPSRNT